MLYDADYTREFYNAYAGAEWNRLETSASGRLKALIHEDFLEHYIKKNDCILDAGSGPGRFSISLAQRGANVTVLDISDTQLALARENIEKAGLSGCIPAYLRGDICDLADLTDASFDVVVCYGGGLSYVCERRYEAAAELVRVTRPGGIILVSVMCLPGALLDVVNAPIIDMLDKPEEEIRGTTSIRHVMETGNLEQFPSRSANMMHAPMHLYTSEELAELFKDCEILETAGSCVTVRESGSQAEEISRNQQAWDTLVELERKLCRDQGLVNSGCHIIMAVRKPE